MCSRGSGFLFRSMDSPTGIWGGVDEGRGHTVPTLLEGQFVGRQEPLAIHEGVDLGGAVGSDADGAGFTYEDYATASKHEGCRQQYAEVGR